MTLIRFFTLSFVVGFAAREADAQSCQALESRANASVQLVQDGEDSPGLTILLPDCVADDRATYVVPLSSIVLNWALDLA